MWVHAEGRARILMSGRLAIEYRIIDDLLLAGGDLAELACAFLRNIAISSEEGAALLLLPEGLALLYKAMDRHRSHAYLQDLCCYALAYMAAQPDGVMSLLQSGAGERIFNAGAFAPDTLAGASLAARFAFVSLDMMTAGERDGIVHLGGVDGPLDERDRTQPRHKKRRV